MDDKEVGQFWNENAVVWTKLARAGFDLYRDQLNTPAFMEKLPAIEGLKGIDIGCGEGYNTRLLSNRGANLTGLDSSVKFIEAAKQLEDKNPLGIEYIVASACEIPMEDAGFDFATAFMCLMDISDIRTALNEAYRILKPGGFLQFSITHPCFATPHRRNLRDDKGQTYAMELGGYFNNIDGAIEEWIFGTVPKNEKKNYRKFRIPVFYRTLSEYLNTLIETGFIIEMMNEPQPDKEKVEKFPSLQDAQVLAYFLHIRCRKPGVQISLV